MSNKLDIIDVENTYHCCRHCKHYIGGACSKGAIVVDNYGELNKCMTDYVDDELHNAICDTIDNCAFNLEDFQHYLLYDKGIVKSDVKDILQYVISMVTKYDAELINSLDESISIDINNILISTSGDCDSKAILTVLDDRDFYCKYFEG